MLLPITSNKTRFLIKLGITAFSPFVMGIKAYDPYRRNAHYFRRKITFKPASFIKGVARRKLQIPMPVSPDLLALELVDKARKGEDDFQIDYLEIEKMPAPKVWATPEQHRFMDHAIQFAQKCGDLPTGYYSSPGHEFLIHYLSAITDSEGKELITPARIHRKMPRVQVSRRMFKQFSIPVRVAILAHEGCHFFNNTRSETEADLCGIKYYLDSGYPGIEAVYALTKVFLLHPHTVGQNHIDRTRAVIDFIDHYKAKKENPKTQKPQKIK